jgi:hypothetical protein
MFKEVRSLVKVLYQHFLEGGGAEESQETRVMAVWLVKGLQGARQLYYPLCLDLRFESSS